MPRRKRDTHLYELAKRGAEARLSDLVHEAKLLMGLFPHLQDAFDRDELPIAFILKKSAQGRRTVAKPRQGRKLSREARAKISAAQKKRWAKVRTKRGK